MKSQNTLAKKQSKSKENKEQFDSVITIKINDSEKNSLLSNRQGDLKELRKRQKNDEL